MIKTCLNCKKQFKINPSQIPEKGRNLQCGSCKHVWLYKIDEKNKNPLTLNEDFEANRAETNIVEKNILEEFKSKQSVTFNKHYKKENKSNKFIENKKLLTAKKKKENKEGKFFSNLFVVVISFVALIILLDTLKTPLINIFPGLEIILFNLFETLKDIKLFIIDLS